MNLKPTIIPMLLVPLKSGSGWHAEQNIAAGMLFRVFTLGALPKYRYSYDLQYEDGLVETDVQPELIRRPVFELE